MPNLRGFADATVRWGWLGCAEMGVSCVCRLFALAFFAVSAASCASIPFGLEAPSGRGGITPSVTGTLDDNDAGSVRKCHEAIVTAGEPYGLIKAATSGLGVHNTIRPIWVTTIYGRQRGPERRTALIDCHLNESGSVVALTAR